MHPGKRKTTSGMMKAIKKSTRQHDVRVAGADLVQLCRYVSAFSLSFSFVAAMMQSFVADAMELLRCVYFLHCGHQGFSCWKKSLPLSSTRMKAGKSSTVIFQMASMPSSGYSTHSIDLMLD